jgi:hypothetical protein
LGTYQTKISAFLTAYAAQQTREAEITGNKFEGGDAMQYLYCVGEKVNDVYVSIIAYEMSKLSTIINSADIFFNASRTACLYFFPSQLNLPSFCFVSFITS